MEVKSPDPVTGTVAAVSAGGSILSSQNNRRAAERATEAQTDASQQQIDLARETRDLARRDNAPFRDFDLQRMNAIGEIYGLSPVSDGGGIQAAQPFGSSFAQNPQYGQPDLVSNGFGGFSLGAGQGAGALQLAGQPQFTQGVASNEGVPMQQPSGNNGLDRFEASPFGAIFSNNFGLETDAIDAGLAAQGLNLSSVRANAKEDARQRNFGNAFNSYLSGLQGTSTNSAANNANQSAGNAYAAQAGNAYGNIGQATAQGAYGRAQANNQLLNGLGGAFGTVLGGF